jgi:hypothetical protein
VYLVPKIVAVAASDVRAFVGEIHDHVPAVVAVEVVAQHSHVVVAVLFAFVNATNGCAQHRTERAECFVVFAVVHLCAHADIAQGGINPKGGFGKITSGFVPPDKRQKLAFLGKSNT